MANFLSSLFIFFLISVPVQAKYLLPSDPNEPNAEQEEERDKFNLSAYKPLYALYNAQSSKIQASFKYRILRNSPIYLGYTHLIIWDWNGESRPFLDVNYNPEFFYRWSFKNNEHLDFIDVTPYGHSSNGKDGEETRSLNYTATQFNFKYDVQENVVFRGGIRLRYMYNFDDTNENIREYYGPWELNFTLRGFLSGIVDKGEISGRFYTGGNFGQDFSKGGQEIGISFRVLGLEITPNFYLQYFHGYNESLRYFNESQNIIRFGILL